MKRRCPFSLSFAFECVYRDNGICDEIEINPGNSDAWCYEMVEKGEAVDTSDRVEEK